MMGKAIEKIDILLDREQGEEAFSALTDLLPQIFHYLNWSSEFCIYSEDLSADLSRIEALGNAIRCFLEHHGFMRVQWILVHPFETAGKTDLFFAYDLLSRPLQPFRQEGYKNLTESRLNLLPIIRASDFSQRDVLISLLDFLKQRFLPTVLYVSEQPFFPFLSQELGHRIERIIIDLEGENDPTVRLLRSIWAHRLFDRLLARAEGSGNLKLEGACPSHLVFAGKTLTLYGCWNDLAVRRPIGLTGEGESSVIEAIDHFLGREHCEKCNACMDKALMAMGPTMRVNKREAETVRVFEGRANMLVQQEHYTKAAAYLTLALDSEKDTDKKAALYVQKGLNHLRSGIPEAALEDLKSAEELAPESGIVQYYSGLCQFQLKDYIEATDLFEEARQKGLPPEILRDLYFYKGIGHIHLEEFDEAIQSMKEAEEVGIARAPVLFYMGMGHLGKAELSEAIYFFQKALEADPAPEDRGRVLFYIGVCEKEGQRYREAIEWLQKACEVEGPSQEIYNLMGFCHFKLKEHDLAISCFEKAIQIDPKSAIDYANIGSNLRELGRMAEAAQMYRKALQIDPSIRFARENLRKLEEMEGKGKESP